MPLSSATPDHSRCRAEVRRLRDRARKSQLVIHVRGRVAAQHVDLLRSAIPSSDRLRGTTSDAPRPKPPGPERGGGPTAASPAAELSDRIEKSQAAVAGVRKLVDDEVSLLLSKLADCADLLAAVRAGATAADREARDAQEQHQRLRLSTATVCDEPRTGLEAVAPALDSPARCTCPCSSCRRPTGRG